MDTNTKQQEMLDSAERFKALVGDVNFNALVQVMLTGLMVAQQTLFQEVGFAQANLHREITESLWNEEGVSDGPDDQQTE